MSIQKAESTNAPASAAPIDIGRLIRRIATQYPFVLVDRVLDYDPRRRLVAIKNVTGSEDFFEGHFPGKPVMPGVLLLESLAQASGIWLLESAPDAHEIEVHVVGFDDVKFRRPVTPGDRLTLEVSLLRRRGRLCRMRGEIRVGDALVAEAGLLLQTARLPPPDVDPSARVAAAAVLERNVRVGPYAVIGPDVRIGAGTLVDAHAVIEGHTTIGANNHVYPFCSIGLAPQDLKYRGETTSLEIGDRNAFRECTTVNRGTAGGGGVTRVGSDNLFMAYSHIAHDCQVGNKTIFGNGATLAGHVLVADNANVGAYSAIHQFCRVGTHAFLGGYTVATRDVVPYSKTVGNRAHFYGANSVGLTRKGFSEESIAAIRKAFQILASGRLPLGEALERLEEHGPHTDEVRGIIAFIRSSERGVILNRRPKRRASESA